MAIRLIPAVFSVGGRCTCNFMLGVQTAMVKTANADNTVTFKTFLRIIPVVSPSLPVLLI
jgi:hypothetical protein